MGILDTPQSLLLFSQLLFAYHKQKGDGKDIVQVFIFSLFSNQISNKQTSHYTEDNRDS